MPSLRSALFRHLVRLGSLSNRSDLTIAELRTGMESGYWFLGLSLPCGTRIETCNAGDLPAEWVTPPRTKCPGTVLFLHGGAFVMGSPRTHRALAARIAAAAGLRALVIDYRLAPEHPFPAAIEDALSAYRWLTREVCQPGEVVGGLAEYVARLADCSALDARSQRRHPAHRALYPPACAEQAPGRVGI